MKYIIDLPENKEVCISDGQQTKIIQPDKNEMVVFNDCEDILKMGFVVKLTPYVESDTAEQAWKIAQDILKDPGKDGMLNRELNDCFGTDDIYLIGAMSYTKVKAKYDAWQKLKYELQIGDEVMHDTCRRCVLLEKKDVYEAELWSVIDEKGVVHQINKIHILRKTGRHFPEVADLLEKMRESKS